MAQLCFYLSTHPPHLHARTNSQFLTSSRNVKESPALTPTLYHWGVEDINLFLCFFRCLMSCFSATAILQMPYLLSHILTALQLPFGGKNIKELFVAITRREPFYDSFLSSALVSLLKRVNVDSITC